MSTDAEEVTHWKQIYQGDHTQEATNLGPLKLWKYQLYILYDLELERKQYFETPELAIKKPLTEQL